MKTVQTLILVICLLAPAEVVAADSGAWINGITEAIDDATLSLGVIGIVKSRPHAEGARVKKGEIILELDNRLEELEAARKDLIRKHAKNDLERSKALAVKSDVSVSQEEIEKKQTEFDVAQADYEFSLEALRRRQVMAPFDGIITEYLLKVGEGCRETQPLVRIVDPSRCHLVLYVDARVGHYLKVAEPVQMEVESGRAFAAVKGQIDFVSPIADPASGLMKVKVAFDNDGRIRPGVSGRMLLPNDPNAN